MAKGLTQKSSMKSKSKAINEKNGSFCQSKSFTTIPPNQTKTSSTSKGKNKNGHSLSSNSNKCSSSRPTINKTKKDTVVPITNYSPSTLPEDKKSPKRKKTARQDLSNLGNNVISLTPFFTGPSNNKKTEKPPDKRNNVTNSTKNGTCSHNLIDGKSFKNPSTKSKNLLSNSATVSAVELLCAKEHECIYSQLDAIVQNIRNTAESNLPQLNHLITTALAHVNTLTDLGE